MLANVPLLPPHKAFNITNIKASVPLILGLKWLNYDAWRELFTTHCMGFDIDHIDDFSFFIEASQRMRNGIKSTR